ncbi:MAG: succinylglutamate desuccinylase/aspartoacylase family protein [Methanobrevibacter sp.]|nr:succinylglutamate desuccinylase/aspartoacylase family protein [Methanobrevibacter sp.]
MKRILILLFVLFISISAVSASENLTDCVSGESDSVVCEGGDSIVLQDDLDGNGSNDSIDGEGNSSGNNSDTENLNETNITIQCEDLVWYVNANPIYKFKIFDSNGTGVAAENVSVTLNGITNLISTDENGVGEFPITGLSAGTYPVTVEYGNRTINKNITLFASRIINAKDISSVYGNKAKFTIRLLNNSGSPMAGVNVTFKIGNKVYTKQTNIHGDASIWPNFNSGNYVIRYSADGVSGKNKYTVTNYVSLEILDWGLTGDVSKAPLIKKNMPDNYWVKKAVEATKKGIPLITIKGGNGKAVFMTAGVHGNELNSQVAMMKMIKYLTTHPIKGTVYIIPFVNVKAISQKVRLTDYDFNRVAHKANTVSNKIIKLIIAKKCAAYGDFHTTVKGGVPGMDVVLGYTSPKGCVAMTNYIVKNAGVNKILYYPGQKYKWSLADYCNSKGTPAVICEVISPVNKVSWKATSLSYSQIKYFLKFNSIF